MLRRAVPTLIALVFAASCGSDAPGREMRVWTPSPPEVNRQAPPALAGFCTPGPKWWETSDSVQPPAPPPEGGQLLSVQTAGGTDNSGLQEPLRCIAEAQAEWETIWARFAANVSPVPPVPEIDFVRQRVLIVSMGRTSQTGYDIWVDSVIVRGDTTYVTVWQESPGEGCDTGEMITASAHAVVIPRTPSQVRLLERAASGPSCR